MSKQEKELREDELEKASGGLKYRSAEGEDLEAASGQVGEPKKGDKSDRKVRRASDPQ